MSDKPKVPAKRNRQSKSTATAREVGIPTEKDRAKANAIIRKVGKASVQGAKPYYREGNGGDIIALALAQADRLPTMRSAGLTTSTSKTEAKRRREWAVSIGAPVVDADSVVHANKRNKGGVLTTRPENAIRSRIRSVAKALGKAEGTYYAIRAERYDGTKDAGVFIVRA